MWTLNQTQIACIVAALGSMLALVAFFIHDRQMAARSAEGKPWVKPIQPLLMLALATFLSIMAAIFALERR